MKKNGLVFGIIGGIGIGLLVGSEFNGSYVTIFGTILIILTFLSIVILSNKERKN